MKRYYIVVLSLVFITVSVVFAQDYNDFSDSGEIIKNHCQKEWPDDFKMQAYCIKQQKNAVNVLEQGPPDDVPEGVFDKIRSKCDREWHGDYKMRAYCEKQQIEAWRALQE